MRLSPAAAVVAVALMFAAGLSPAHAAGEPDVFTVGDGPSRIAFSPDGSRFYVLHYYAETLTAYNTATRQVIFTAPVGDQPAEFDVSPDGGRIFVANAGSPIGGLTVVNTATGAATNTDTSIPLYDVAVSPNGSRLYTIGVGTSLSAHDPVSGAFAHTISPPYAASSLVGLTFDATGTYLYVLEGNWGGAHRMNVASESFGSQFGWGAYGGSALLTPDGTRVVLPTSGSLMVVDLLG